MPTQSDQHRLPGLGLTQPATVAEWKRYYDLRWRLLREPWNQPRDTERDERDSEGFHAMLRDPAGAVVAIGRLHLNSPDEAQIRYMAVDEAWRGRGLGKQILHTLENHARTQLVKQMMLSAREEAVKFYSKQGYRAEGSAETLFGDVRHVLMRKKLATN